MAETFNLCFSALNQFYYYDNKHLSYDSLSRHVLGEIIPKEKIKADGNLDYTHFRQAICTHFNIDKHELTTYLQALVKPKLDKISFVSADKLAYVTNLGITVIFFHENPLMLLLDELILSTCDCSFDHKFVTTNELIDKIKAEGFAKDNIVLNNSIESLLKFHQLGCWTVLLTDIIFSHEDVEGDLNENASEFCKIKTANLDYLKQNLKFFSFASNNFYQLHFYYNEIRKVNNEHSELVAKPHHLNEKINKISPVRVLLCTRTLRRSQEFKKQRYYISDEKVLYMSHIGGDDVSVNGKFDTILSKAVEVKDLQLYKSLFENIVSYSKLNNVSMLNNLQTLDKFVEKDLQGEFLEEFCKEESVVKMSHQFDHNLAYPSSQVIPMTTLQNKELFFKFLDESKMAFPLVIKYKGKSTFYKHLISFIFNKDCYDKFISEFGGEESEGVNCVVQTFVNHGGKVFKLYRICGENYIDMRSSLPDISPELQANFPDGFWTFKTIELESEKYVNMLDQYRKNSDKLQSLDHKVLFRFAEAFEEFSKYTLFGLDFMFDYLSGGIYIIDCNSLPGYKIKIDIAGKLRDHVVKYTSI